MAACYRIYSYIITAEQEAAMNMRNTGKGHVFTNVVLILLIVGLYILTANPGINAAVSVLKGGIIYRGQSSEKEVGLECIAAWDAAALEPMLDILDERMVTISFFVSGTWASEHAELLRRMVASGHEIGIVGYDPQNEYSLSEREENIASAKKIITQLAGVVPRLYMPLTQSKTMASRAALAQGCLTVLCSVDTMGASGSSEQIAQRALDSLYPGKLILLTPTANTLEALPTILDGFSEAGYRVVPAGSLIGETI
jgi:peptidoglycan/xylan/chitin deacetylase (PgdA/CDA1 family)